MSGTSLAASARTSVVAPSCWPPASVAVAPSWPVAGASIEPPSVGGTAAKPTLKCMTFPVSVMPVAVPPMSSKPPLAFDQKRCAPGVGDASGIETVTGCAKVVPAGPNSHAGDTTV